MRLPLFLFVPAFVAAIGCQSLSQAEPSPQETQTVLQSCSASAASAKLRLDPVAEDTVAATIRADPRARAARFDIVEALAVSGACAGALRMVRMDNVLLADGSALRRTADNELMPRDPLSLAEETIDQGEAHPQGPGKFVMAFRAGYRRVDDTLKTDYVGIWQDGKRAVVAGYTSSPDAGYTTPRTVLSSSLPLRSVSYFPAPDTRSGRLGLLQKQADGTLRLIGVDWSHPGFFE